MKAGKFKYKAYIETNMNKAGLEIKIFKDGLPTQMKYINFLEEELKK